MINWKVRIRQKWFWLTLIPLVFLLGDQLVGLMSLMGEVETGHLYEGPLMEMMLKLIGTAFAVLALVGVPVDTTTEGYGDSARALTYEAPAPNASAYGLQEYEEQCAAANAKMVDWAAQVASLGESCTVSAAELADVMERIASAPREGSGGEDGDR